MQLEDPWIEHPAIQWAISNRKNIAYYALILLLLLIAAYRFLAGASQQKERDFIAAANEAEAVQTSDNPESALQNLSAILSRHKELQTKYDGIIAQALLNDDKTEEALLYANSSLERFKDTTPDSFLEYSKNTLLIAQNNWNEALANSIALKEKIDNPTLYLFNLVRIALLQKELKLTKNEKESWNEIQNIKNGTHKIKLSQTEAQRILSHYEMQGTTLKDFSEK